MGTCVNASHPAFVKRAVNAEATAKRKSGCAIRDILEEVGSFASIFPLVLQLEMLVIFLRKPQLLTPDWANCGASFERFIGPHLVRLAGIQSKTST